MELSYTTGQKIILLQYWHTEQGYLRTTYETFRFLYLLLTFIFFHLQRPSCHRPPIPHSIRAGRALTTVLMAGRALKAKTPRPTTSASWSARGDSWTTTREVAKVCQWKKNLFEAIVSCTFTYSLSHLRKEGTLFFPPTVVCSVCFSYSVRCHNYSSFSACFFAWPTYSDFRSALILTFRTKIWSEILAAWPKMQPWFSDLWPWGFSFWLCVLQQQRREVNHDWSSSFPSVFCSKCLLVRFTLVRATCSFQFDLSLQFSPHQHRQSHSYKVCKRVEGHMTIRTNEWRRQVWRNAFLQEVGNKNDVQIFSESSKTSK